MGINERLAVLNSAKERIKKIEFGDPVTNVCAGENNPRRHAYFCKYFIKSHKNKYGIIHNDYHAKCTDKKGNFWNAGIETIFSGHLDSEQCKELFSPIWEAHYQ